VVRGISGARPLRRRRSFWPRRGQGLALDGAHAKSLQLALMLAYDQLPCSMMFMTMLVLYSQEVLELKPQPPTASC